MRQQRIITKSGFATKSFAPLVLCTFIWLNTSYAIIGIEDLKPGMKGIGKTVFRGLKIESFGVEVIDVLRGSMPHTDVVLIRVSGKNIEQIGGVCAGMSGSPVLINGELAGAISYAEPLSDTKFAYMTPAQDIMSLFEYEEVKGNRTKDAEARLEGMQLHESISWFSREHTIITLSPLNWEWALLQMRLPMPGWHCISNNKLHSWMMGNLVTPLMVCGLSGRAMRQLQSLFGRFGLHAVASSGSASGHPKLEMGSAIAIQFTHGDVSLTAIGTLTCNLGDRFVAFGHPILRRGATQFGLTGAYIHQVVRSLVMPFKVGSPIGGTIGTVTQDRERGIAGYLGRLPEWTELSIKVEGDNSGQIKAKVSPDRDLLPTICGIVLLDAIDKALDRVGEGTADLRWEVSIKDNLSIERSEKVYSASDVSSECAFKLMRWLKALVENEFERVRIRQIEMSAQVTQRRMTARICKLSLPGIKLRRGEEVELTLQLQPFGDETKVKHLKIRIPKDTPKDVVIVARGKQAVDDVSLRLLSERLTAHDCPTSFDELIKLLSDEPTGTEVLVEVWDANEWRMLKLIERFMATRRPQKLGWIEPQELLAQEKETHMPTPSGVSHPIASLRVKTEFVIQGQVEVAATLE